MSFLYQSSRTLLRNSHPATRSATRAFSTTLQQRKTATETVKDGLKKVDRTVADAAVVGIEKGQELTGKAKETAGINAKKAEGSASEVAGEAKGKAAELKGEAKGKAEEVKGKI